jgi:protein TonB
MKKKKSTTANQEKNKTIYVLIGLALSMAFSLEWLEWGDKKLNQQYIESSLLSFIDDEPMLELTSQPKPVPPKPKPVVSEPVVVDNKATVVIEKPVNKKQPIVNTITVKTDLYNEDLGDETLKFEELPLDFAQQMPSFPGGEKPLLKFLRKNTNYPEFSREINSQGTVYVSFVVEKDGSISAIKILDGVDKHINKESIRVIQSMPKWKPGEQMGKKVRVRQILPIKFILLN